VQKLLKVRRRAPVDPLGMQVDQASPDSVQAATHIATKPNMSTAMTVNSNIINRSCSMFAPSKPLFPFRARYHRRAKGQ
jgi:hypothetical protein